MEGPNIIYRVALAPSRHLQRGVLPPGIRPFQERPVFCSRLNDGMRHTCHLGSERGHLLATSIGIIRVTSHIAAELVAETVVALAATCAAIQKVRRSRALPYFDSLVRPRNVPDWQVARSRPQNFRNCR